MALSDPLRVSDGFFTTIGGVNSGIDPSDLLPTQLAWAVNARNRGGKPKPRPAFVQHKLTGVAATQLNFQGKAYYEDNPGKGYFIMALNGRLFRLKPGASTTDIQEITIPGDPQNSAAPIIFFRQAGRYMVIQDGVTKAVIFDGAKCRRAGAKEVPIGSGPMAFGQGRLWVALGNEFVAGDIDGGPTGVLMFTENDYLAEGGRFKIPLQAGRITSMQFVPSLNTALGQGELIICTPDAVFSLLVPINRDLWKELVDPVQRVTVLNNGAASDASTVLANSDVLMTSRDGFRTVIQAVRDFGSPGNVPISREINRVINNQNQSLLKFCSSIIFQNRMISTIQPQSRHNGAWFKSLAILDFDPLSAQGQKSPPVWDGVWDGYEFLWLAAGRFSRVERAFTVVRNRLKGFVKSVLVSTPTTEILEQPANVSAPDAGGTTAVVYGLYRCNPAVAPVVVTAGTGYVPGDVVTIDGPKPKFVDAAFMVLTVNGSGGITSVMLVAGRHGLYVNPPVDFGGYLLTGGHGTLGRLRFTSCLMDRATVNGFNIVDALVTAGGAGYVLDELITVTGPTGITQAIFEVTGVSGGVVTAVTLVDGGHYNVPPIGPYATTSNLSGAGLTLTISRLHDSGEPINSGSGYMSQPTITFTTTSAVPSAAVVVPFMDYEWELWEITADGKFDLFRDLDDNQVERRITMVLESPSYRFTSDRSARRDQKRLMGAEMAIHRITGTVDFVVKFRPDQFPCWQNWHNFQFCAIYKDCIDAENCAPKTYLEQSRPRVGIPTPPVVFDEISLQPLDLGREFQVRIEMTGFAEIKMLEVVANRIVEPNNPPCAPAVAVCEGLVCPCEETA